MDAGDASLPDASPPDASLPDAAARYFEEVTAASFPAPGCVGLPADAGVSRRGCFTSWLTFSDIDHDNDLDILFANGGNYYARAPYLDESTVYINDGHGNFTDVTETWFGGAKSQLRQVSVADIDGDGDRDIYQPGGYGVDLDKLWVQKAPGVFENKAAELLPSGLMSWAGAAHLGDLDGDGDMDLAVADWGQGGPNANVPDGGTPVWNANSSGSRIPDPGKTLIYYNDGTGKFTQAESGVVPPPIPFVMPTPDAAVPEAGWPDGGIPEAGYPDKQRVFGRTPIDIDFADIDNDFDLDILVNHRNGQSRTFKNDGTGKFTDFTFEGTGIVDDAGYLTEAVLSPAGYTDAGTIIGRVPDWDAGLSPNYPVKRGPYVYNQELCDLDGDGDLDMLLDNAAADPPTGGQNFTQVLINDGTGRFVDRSREMIFGEPGADDNAVKCADVNGDGKYDLVVASLGNFEKLLLNDGNGIFNFVPNGVQQVRDPSLGIDMGDLDGDGLLDLVTGQGEGTGWLDRYYKGVRESKPDVTPPFFRAVEHPVVEVDKPIVMRMGVGDRVTSETGEHVRSVTVEYKVNGGAVQIVKATFIGGDLFRAVIPAQANGTMLSITPKVVDLVGLTTTAPVWEVTVGEYVPPPDASVPDAEVPPDGEPDASVGEPDASVGTMDASISTPDASDEEEEEEDRTGKKKDDGCSVAAPGAAGGASSGLFFALGMAMLSLRNLRARRRRGE